MHHLKKEGLTKLIRCDFHCHTEGSADSLTTFQEVRNMLEKTALDRLCITDHNAIDSARSMQEKDPEHIIVGEEVMTTGGELLGFFLKECIPGGLKPMAAIEQMLKQGAVISVSHPFDIRRCGWQVRELEEILPFIDAVEIFNARCRSMAINEQAMVFAGQKGIAGTAGSDAHTPVEIGGAWLELQEFTDAESLRIALQHGEIGGKKSSLLVHAGSRWAALVNQIKRIVNDD